MKKVKLITVLTTLLLIIASIFNFGLSSFISGASLDVFIKDAPIAVCHIGSVKYTSIGKAIESATSGQTIYVYPGNTDLNNLNYEIRPTDATKNIITLKQNVTLSIPYETDKANNYKASIYNATKGLGKNPLTPKSVVTLKEGITFINNGIIDIGGEISAGGGNSPSSYTTSNYSALFLGENSIIQNIGTINVYGYIGEKTKNNNSKIICQNNFKYTSEANEVTVTGNSIINLPFYRYDYCGGSALKAIYDNIKEKMCMPFDDFYFENITPIVIFYGGSQANAWVNLYAADTYGSYILELINTNNSAIISFKNETSYLVCNYDESTYVMSMDFYGTASFNELNIDVEAAIKAVSSGAWLIASLAGIPSSVSSSSGYFPITFHFNISLNSLPNETNTVFNGSVNRYKIMNGGNLIINKGVTLKAKAITTYDGWDYYTGRSTHANAQKVILNQRSDLLNKESLFVVNGTLECESACGKFITSSENSRISSKSTVSTTMYEPKKGSGSQTKAVMEEWFSKTFSLTLNNESNVLETITNPGIYDSFSGDSFYYWKLNEDKRIKGVSITANKTTGISDKGEDITLTANISPENYETPYTLTYTWSEVTSSGITITPNNSPSPSIKIPANTEEVEKTYTVKCVIEAKYSDESEPRKWSDTIDLTQDKKSTDSGGCLTENSLVMLANGDYKKAIDIRAGDLLMTINHENGQFEAAPVVFNDDYNKEADDYNVITLEFSNGKTVEVVYEHGFFDLDTMKYEYIKESNYKSFIGHKFVTVEQNETGLEKGEATLIRASLSNKHLRICSPVTYKNLDIITDGMLSMPGGITGIFNIFDYDSDLSYNVEKKQKDIEKYGLFDYSHFEDRIPYEFYEAFNGQYLKVAIGKGILTEEMIDHYIDIYLPISNEQNAGT